MSEADAKPNSADRSIPRGAVDLFYGAAVLVICIGIWQASRPQRVPPSIRQVNLRLLESIEQLGRGLEATSRIWILCQDNEEGDLLRRKIAYGLIPNRTIYLPRNIRPPGEQPTIPVNPLDGCRATLGDGVAFSDAESFRRYLRNTGVTHIVVAQGDALLSSLTGLALHADRMYLLRFDAADDRLTEERSVARP